MIRSVIIVLLALGACVSGTIGGLAGSGCTSRVQPVWSIGKWGMTGSRDATLGWGTSKIVMLTHVEFLGTGAVPSEHRCAGYGWAFASRVGMADESDIYVRSRALAFSFVYPLIIAIVLAVYPVQVLIRGPLRRWRWVRHGLCIACGYDLRGNESGVCPECGTDVPCAV